MGEEVKDKDLKEAIKTFKQARDLYYNNKFNEAEELTSGGESPYYLVFRAQLCAQKAVLTFERDEIRDAVEKIGSAQIMLETHRREENVASTLINIVFARDLDQFEETELHCEVAWAQMLLIKAMMDFIEGENILSFIKGALGTKNAYQLYHELYDYMEKRKLLAANGLQPAIDKHFESLVSFGYGVFTLYLSLMPQKVLNMLELVGVHGSKSDGLAILERGEIIDGMFSETNGIILLHYNLMLCPYARMELDDELVERLMNKYCDQWPNSVIFNLLRGKREMIKRNPRVATDIYTTALEVDSDWEFFKYTLYLELTWSNMVVGEWSEAERYSTMQFENSNRSKTFFSFLQLLNHYAANPSDTEQLIKYAKEIPKHQMVIAGKHLHAEKYAIRKARSFLKNKNFLFCPHYEMMYLFGLTDFADNKRLAVIKKEIEEALDDVENKKPYYHENKIDDWFLGQILLANVARLEGAYEKSRNLLETALQSEDSLEVDHMLAPYAHYDMAWSFYISNKLMEARTHLYCAKEYSTTVKSYCMEESLVFKIQCLNLMVDDREKERRELTSVTFIQNSPETTYYTVEESLRPPSVDPVQSSGDLTPAKMGDPKTEKDGEKIQAVITRQESKEAVIMKVEDYEVVVGTDKPIADHGDCSIDTKPTSDAKPARMSGKEKLVKTSIVDVLLAEDITSDSMGQSSVPVSVHSKDVDNENELDLGDFHIETTISNEKDLENITSSIYSDITADSAVENIPVEKEKSVYSKKIIRSISNDERRSRKNARKDSDTDRGYNIKNLIRRFESMDNDTPVESPMDEIDEIFKKYEDKRKQREHEVEVDGIEDTDAFMSKDDPFNQTFNSTPNVDREILDDCKSSRKSSVKLVNSNFETIEGGSDTVSSYNMDEDHYFGSVKGSVDGLEDDSDSSLGGSGIRYACVPKVVLDYCGSESCLKPGKITNEMTDEEADCSHSEIPLEERMTKEQDAEYVGLKAKDKSVKSNPKYDRYRQEEEMLKENYVQLVNEGGGGGSIDSVEKESGHIGGVYDASM